MNHFIGWLLGCIRTLLATGTGHRARRPQHRTALRETALAWIPTPAPTPVRPPTARRDPEARAYGGHDDDLQGPLVRPYVDTEAWRRELDEMQAEYEVAQLTARRAAAAAAAAGNPDPGYTYVGVHRFAGTPA